MPRSKQKKVYDLVRTLEGNSALAEFQELVGLSVQGLMPLPIPGAGMVYVPRPGGPRVCPIPGSRLDRLYQRFESALSRFKAFDAARVFSLLSRGSVPDLASLLPGGGAAASAAEAALGAVGGGGLGGLGGGGGFGGGFGL